MLLLATVLAECCVDIQLSMLAAAGAAAALYAACAAAMR
jgi:hypothetical protein